MSGKLPSVTPDQLLRALHRDGWSERRRSGSHIILVHDQKPGRVVVLYHWDKEIKPGTLASIIAQAGLSREEFRRLL